MMWKKLKRAAQSSGGWRRRMTRASSSSATQVAGPTERVESVVVGAGVVGLAVARELSVRGREVVVVDAGPTFGTGTSSRSSEVVHAGIYYPPASYKAAFCVRGRELLYRYCSERGIPHEQIGKLIVATNDSEVPKLCDLMERGRQNGVVGLEMMDGSDAARMEPELRCVKALHSPISGIVDSHSFMLSLVGEAESQGATLSYNSTVIGGNLEGDQPQLHVIGTKSLESWDGKSPLHPELTLLPKLIVNSAGLSAIALARRFSGLPSSVVPPAHFARGCYFTLSNTRTPPFHRLIYPMPEDGGIGVHVTLDLDGQVKFGPNVEWINSVDDVSSFLNKYNYSVNLSSAEKFYAEIRKYYPNIKDGSLEPGYAGIRPKFCGPKQPSTDFIIQVISVLCVSALFISSWTLALLGFHPHTPILLSVIFDLPSIYSLLRIFDATWVALVLSIFSESSPQVSLQAWLSQNI